MSTQPQRLAAIAELEKVAIPLPAEQPGRPSLAQMIHCALVEYADTVARETTRRRTVEAALRCLLIVVEQVEHIGLDEDLYQAAISGARAVLLELANRDGR